MRVNVYCFNVSAKIRFFVKVLIDTNVNIRKELNFYDVIEVLTTVGRCKVYMSAFGVSFTLHAIQCSLYFDKPQKK